MKIPTPLNLAEKASCLILKGQVEQAGIALEAAQLTLQSHQRWLATMVRALLQSRGLDPAVWTLTANFDKFVLIPPPADAKEIPIDNAEGVCSEPAPEPTPIGS